MGVLNNSMWNVASGASNFYEHQIPNSLRIPATSSTSSSNGRLTQTFGTVDSKVHFTLNFWIKKAVNGGLNPVTSARPLTWFTPRSGTSGSVLHEFKFCSAGAGGSAGDALMITNTNSNNIILSTNNLFRDTSAWYNIHIQADLDNGTNSEKLKIFVNGTEASYNTDNRGSFTNMPGIVAGAWTIGDYYNYGYPAQCYFAQWAYVDGTTYAPTVFGESKNGAWIPKDLSSGITWGSAGHLLMFQDSSALGDDTSGEGNDWATANIAAHDQMKDTPTFGSDNGGNFATLGPLARTSDILFREGNLAWTGSANERGMLSNWAIPVGSKVYFEYYASAWAGSENDTQILGVNQAHAALIGGDRGGDETAYSYRSNGYKAILTTKSVYGSEVSWGTGSIISCAVDRVNHTINFAKNNSYQGTFAISDSLDLYPFVGNGGGTSVAGGYINFGADGTFAGTKTAGGNADENGYGNFIYAPPSGFLAMCSANLTVATEVDPAQDVSPNKFFDTVLYTGDGGANTSITSLNFQPDWLLIKNRDTTDGWLNQNSVSGVGVTHEWNDDGPYESETDCIKSFNSDGWTMSNDHKVNANTEKYVAYGWKKSADAGFDIVEYSGTGSTNAVSHSLGAAPDCIMMHLKSGSDWDSTMYFNSPNMGLGKGVFMTLANAAQATQYMTATTSSTFTPTSSANSDGRVYVAYLFRSIDGYSKFGEFEGNANADGPMIYTGFRPKFVFFKAIDQAENWQIRDTARNPQNIGSALRIYWNTNSGNASASTASPIDFLANGFKVRGSNTEINSNTIIYGAWADVPFKYNTTL